MNKKGFTYIDTVISICVAAVVISMFILAYSHFTNYSERAEMKSIVQIIKKSRLSAIMQSSEIDLSLDDDKIIILDTNDIKKEYKLKHLKFKTKEHFVFTSEGGTKSFMDKYYVIVLSSKSKKQYKIVLAAVGGQVRYEEI